jgi:hypothetical protein
MIKGVPVSEGKAPKLLRKKKKQYGQDHKRNKVKTWTLSARVNLQRTNI